MSGPGPLAVTIGGVEYVLPPIGWAAGAELAKYFTMTQQQLGKVKTPADVLYELAVGSDTWARMKDDGADYILMHRAGLAALGHFRKRLEGGTDEDARRIFDAIWESGVDPEALAAYLAAHLESSTTSPATRPPARGSSTKPRASTASTRSRTAAPSRGRNSSTRKRSG